MKINLNLFGSISFVLILASCNDQTEGLLHTSFMFDSAVEEVKNEESSETNEAFDTIEKILKQIISDEKDAISNIISYPLKRSSPLPPINNKVEFIANWDVLIDENLKVILREFLDEPDFIDRRGVDGTIGINVGEIWFNESGKAIITLNYSSEAEKSNREKLEKKIKNSVHPIIRNYIHNQYLGKTERYLFRIDETENGLRYAQWRSNQTMADEPDFILYDGISEGQGSAGGWQTIFENKDRYYILNEVVVCEDIEDCGDFLIIQNEEEIFYEGKVEEILNPFDVLPN